MIPLWTLLAGQKFRAFARCRRPSTGCQIARARGSGYQLAAAHNLLGVHFELVAQFPEMGRFAEAFTNAEEEYMPSGPPMSPLTGSYFHSWAFYDLAFGAQRESIASCLIAVGKAMRSDPRGGTSVARHAGVLLLVGRTGEAVERAESVIEAKRSKKTFGLIVDQDDVQRAQDILNRARDR